MITNHPQPHEVYKHYKRDTLYRILCIATRETDVVLDDGSIVKRFALVDAAAA